MQFNVLCHVSHIFKTLQTYPAKFASPYLTPEKLKYRAVVNYQEKICSAGSGRSAYSTYRGSHEKDSGNNFLTSSDPTSPDIDGVFSLLLVKMPGGGFSPFPQHENGVDLTFLMRADNRVSCRKHSS